jgi:hypothetical protein
MFYFMEFLKRNPTELVIFFFEMRSDVDLFVDLQDFWFLLAQVMGFVEMVYVHDTPDSETPWPTLRELISNNEVSLACDFYISIVCTISE